MKNLKKTMLVISLSAILMIGGYGASVQASPQWLTNYLDGKTTPAGSQYTDPGVNQPETPTTEPTTPATGDNSNKWFSSDYWRSKYGGGSYTPSDPTPVQPTPPSTDPDQSEPGEGNLPGISQEEHTLLELLNQERTARGLQPLQLNAQLTQLARVKAKDMADNNYFSHTSPTYGKAADMVRNTGISHWIVGENIAKTSSAARANDLFMGSSVHRATMLSKNFTEVGIGMYRKSNGTLYVSEIFIGTR